MSITSATGKSRSVAPEVQFARSGFAAILKRLSPAWLIRLDATHRAYRAFKALDEERLADLGITREAQEAATFADFRDMPLR